MQTERFDVTDLFTEDDCNPARISLTDLADGILFTQDPEWRAQHMAAVREIFEDKVRALCIDYGQERVYAIVEARDMCAIVDLCDLPITHVCFGRQEPVVFPRSGMYN